MDRRKFVGTLGLGAAAAALAACGKEKQGETAASGKQQTFEWKLVTTWPKNYPGLGTGPENFAKLVDKMSDGRLKVRVFGAGELVPAFEVFDAVSQGSAEMGHSAAYYWKGKHPATPFFTTVPFGMTATEMNGWIHQGGGMALWEELYDRFNLKPFAGGNTGVQMAGWFNKKINSVADLKGLKMRIPGLGGEVLKRVGGTPVQLPGGELFTSLQTGAIDATEWVGPWNDLTFGFQKIARYYYYPGWHEPGPMLEFLVNKDAWKKLPPDLQVIVETATRAINQGMLDEYTARNNDALQELKSKFGVKVLPLPDDVLKALKKASDQVVSELAASDPIAKKVYDSFDKFRQGVIAYERISEQSYMDIRTRLIDEGVS